MAAMLTLSSCINFQSIVLLILKVGDVGAKANAVFASATGKIVIQRNFHQVKKIGTTLLGCQYVIQDQCEIVKSVLLELQAKQI